MNYVECNKILVICFPVLMKILQTKIERYGWSYHRLLSNVSFLKLPMLLNLMIAVKVKRSLLQARTWENTFQFQFWIRFIIFNFIVQNIFQDIKFWKNSYYEYQFLRQNFKTTLSCSGCQRNLSEWFWLPETLVDINKIMTPINMYINIIFNHIIVL